MSRNYIVDFPAMMRVYETNYAKLMSLLPKEDATSIEYVVCGEPCSITINEETRYTTLVTIEMATPASTEVLKVRLYHDARVAEVCAIQQTGRLNPKYDYPNAGMYQKDEKHQVNQFLHDCLVHCLRHGISKASMYKLN